jgi:hypothetical protein
MKRTLTAFSVALLALTGHAFAADTNAQCSVQVTGVRVIAPSPGGNDDLRAFNGSPGVTVAVVVTAPSGNILGIDTDASKLEKFSDDKGGNLLESKSENSFNDAGFTSWSSFSDKGDNSAKSVEIHAPGQPAKGATQFIVTGTLNVQTALKSEQFTAENVVLKPGTKLKLGSTSLTISSIRMDTDGMGISLNAKQDLSNIATVEFFHADGTLIESDLNGTTTSNSGESKDVTQEYSLKKNVDKLKIVATCWTDMKTTEVPIQIKTGVGL